MRLYVNQILQNEVLMRAKSLCRVLGVSLLSFGIGILLSFFLPEAVLVVTLALVIVAVGLLYFLQK